MQGKIANLLSSADKVRLTKIIESMKTKRENWNRYHVFSFLRKSNRHVGCPASWFFGEKD